MGHHYCCKERQVKRGLWSPEEDQKLITYITNNGFGSWSTVPQKAGLERCGKSCRFRWLNYLRPDIKRGRFTHDEERLIIKLHAAVGNSWAHMAKHLPGRTDNEIKNYWNSWIKKKLNDQKPNSSHEVTITCDSSQTQDLTPNNYKPQTDNQETLALHSSPTNTNPMFGSSENNPGLDQELSRQHQATGSSYGTFENNLEINYQQEVQALSNEPFTITNCLATSYPMPSSAQPEDNLVPELEYRSWPSYAEGQDNYKEIKELVYPLMNVQQQHYYYYSHFQLGSDFVEGSI